ncbi:hypothetical protein lerEdw1_013193 [Lerista edwardsae]|nr:hypothetical protein lerEdw1_013193 [Lerista edwardsae]
MEWFRFALDVWQDTYERNFSECALPPIKTLLQSQKELCTVSAEDLKEEDNFNENCQALQYLTNAGFTNAHTVEGLVQFFLLSLEEWGSPSLPAVQQEGAIQKLPECPLEDAIQEFTEIYLSVQKSELSAMSIELPDLLKSIHLCNLHENEVFFLKDIPKPLAACDILKQKNHRSRVLCVMRLSPSFPRLIDSVFTLLSKYAAGIRCTVEMCLLQKSISDISHTEDDDTNRSVSSIEDDFVTALEHLDEDDPTKICSGQVTPEKCQDAASQTSLIHSLKSADPKFVNSVHQKSAKPSASLVNILERKELSSSERSSVTTSVSDPWIQRSFFKHHNSSDQSLNVLHKALFSSSPADSSESDCSSPSPVIFLDEEGYQRSLKAKLQLPKIPVMKDGVEDSDSEVSEFFDSFDQFDEQEQTLESSLKHGKDPVPSNPSQKKMISYKKSCSKITAMNPQKFRFDRPTLPANVRKPTPRKPESPYGSLLDVPDSPRPVKTSGDDSGGLFSPIRSSAFSPLGSCFSTECLCRRSFSRDTVNQNHNLLCHAHSDFANNISIEILGSVFNSRSSLCRHAQDVSNINRIVSNEEKNHIAKRKATGRELEKKGKSKHRSLIIKNHIQKFASELVEKSFGSAFKELHKGFSSCTNALCHLAAKLTSSVFQMAFYEIGKLQTSSLKEKAINGLAGFLVSEAITGALKELRSVKQQIFTNTVAKFAAELAEELIFEGIMEVCQFSQPSTPAASQNWFFHYNDNVVKSYARDLSESVIQEAFIELSQADVTFTTQAAISISMDNMKYIGAESMMESTQTSSAFFDFDDKVPVVINPLKELKEYTIHEALFYTSGIASSIPVPFAGSILCQTDNSPGSECNVHFKEVNHSEISSISTGEGNISNFSGTMVDMIVTEAYETVTSSKVSKTAEQYTNMLKMETTPYLQCIGEDTCKNVFANYLAKRIVKQSIDETKSACSATSEKFAYCVGLGTYQKSNIKELHSAVKQSDKKKIVPVIVGQQQMPLNNSSKFHVTPVYYNRCLLSGSKESVEEKKRHVPCKASSCMPSPCSSVTFIKCVEEFPDLENSAKSLSNPLEKRNVYKTAGCSGFPHEKVLDMNTLTSVMSSCDDAFQIEDKLSIRDGNLCVVPDTPPPTPLIPSQASSDWNLRKLTKKLKGQLAKEFAPATPPSTPYRSEIDEMSENEHHYLEKEEFILKLMRSLSEEVESSEGEDLSESLAERVKTSFRTTEYADHLASHIISMATEMAASNLDDKMVQLENKYFQLSMEDKRCAYTTFMSVPEKTFNSLWVYAGDMAGKVISEAKKIVKSRNFKFLRRKQVNHQADCFHHKRSFNEYWSKDRRYPLADQWSRETDSILSLPQTSQDPGLTSKYPSCESVTDEYADHIIQILKREGGHSELIMDQFASRVAYRSIKSGMQQAARKLKMKYNRKTVPAQPSELNSELELFELINMNTDKKKQKKGSIHQFGKLSCENKCNQHKTECTKLLDFSESLAQHITHNVRKRIKMSAACLPKSLTDSCLYKTSEVAEPKMFTPFSCKQKLYHSTGSLNEYTYRDGIIQAIEQYARKVINDTLEVSLESASLQMAENWTNGDRATYADKLSPFSATACGYCGVKEHYAGRSSLNLPEQELYSEVRQIPNTRLGGICPKTHVLHLDIPKIHIDMDEKVAFAENVAATTLDRTERQLSNASLAADSGIGQEGVSFAESLTTEIMTSCMTNIGQSVNISSMGKERFNSAESIVSQPMSLSTGDDSTGSWSNLSFEDEHPDENSSFLHLSDSDGTEDNEEELKDTVEGLGHTGKALVIINVDIGACMMDSQLRMTLQWLSASEAEVAELHFHGDAAKEFVILSKKLQERGWKVGDLCQAVLKYCEVMEKATDGERTLESETFFGWLQEHV